MEKRDNPVFRAEAIQHYTTPEMKRSEPRFMGPIRLRLVWLAFFATAAISIAAMFIPVAVNEKVIRVIDLLMP